MGIETGTGVPAPSTQYVIRLTHQTRIAMTFSYTSSEVQIKRRRTVCCGSLLRALRQAKVQLLLCVGSVRDILFAKSRSMCNSASVCLGRVVEAAFKHSSCDDVQTIDCYRCEEISRRPESKL